MDIMEGGVTRICRELEAQGKCETLSAEEFYKIRRSIDMELEEFNREYKDKQFLSRRAAQECFINY